MSESQTSSDAGDSFASQRFINTSAIKVHALKCSEILRAGHFERVGTDFINDIQAETEALIRKFNSLYLPPIHPVIPALGWQGDPASFATGLLMERLREALDQCIARMIQSKVQRHPTIGKTLKA